MAVITGVALGALALVAFKIGTNATLALTTVLLTLAASEFFLAIRRGGYQPATLLGMTAVAALNLGAYWRFEAAVPLVLALTVVFSLLWYLTGGDRNMPLANISMSGPGPEATPPNPWMIDPRGRTSDTSKVISPPPSSARSVSLQSAATQPSRLSGTL